MDKNTLKNIAKDWTKGILLGCETLTFVDAEREGVITAEEADYIVREAHKIAGRITKREALPTIDDIFDRYNNGVTK